MFTSFVVRRAVLATDDTSWQARAIASDQCGPTRATLTLMGEVISQVMDVVVIFVNWGDFSLKDWLKDERRWDLYAKVKIFIVLVGFVAALIGLVAQGYSLDCKSVISEVQHTANNIGFGLASAGKVVEDALALAKTIREEPVKRWCKGQAEKWAEWLACKPGPILPASEPRSASAVDLTELSITAARAEPAVEEHVVAKPDASAAEPAAAEPDDTEPDAPAAAADVPMAIRPANQGLQPPHPDQQLRARKVSPGTRTIVRDE